LDDFEHPVVLEEVHADLDCSACHTGGQDLTYECANCHTPPENHLPGTCDTCHNPEGWAQSASALVSVAPEIEHELDGREDCLVCHDPAGNVVPAPSNHVDYGNEQCTLCHKVGD
jgi:hypothetical protein